MALYLPPFQPALDTVDDPTSAPVDTEAFPNLTVIPITHDELADPRTPRKLGRKLARRAHLSAPVAKRLTRALVHLAQWRPAER